jgi:hypothetical protein
MANREEVRSAVGESKSEFQCVMFPEQYHSWAISKPWDADPIKKAELAITAIEVKASKVTGECDSCEYDKNSPLILDCGVQITSGRTAITTQNSVARFFFRVDSVRELNEAMRELSNTFSHRNWVVSKLEVLNVKLGATLYYTIHSPNGLESRLYLKSAETNEYSKCYELINIFEQQRLCNNFYEYFAQCSIVDQVVKAHSCALERRKNLGRKQAYGLKRKAA